MRKMRMAAAAAALVTGVVGASADEAAVRLFAALHPLNEVPAVSSPASGRFSAVINDTGSIDFDLSWENLQAGITQAHIHFAQPNVNGAIVVWLCGTTTNPGPMGTAGCPAGSPNGAISGTITAAQVIAASTQGISLGDYEEVVRAMRLGFAYANVHTAGSPGGEVRGQIRVRKSHPRHDDRH